MKINYSKIYSDIFSGLRPRTKDIVSRRFGLGNQQRETLESIGQDYAITRERVRQIEFEALSKLSSRIRRYKKLYQDIVGVIKSFGNLKREDALFSLLGDKGAENSIYFLLTLGEGFKRYKETEQFYPFWAIEDDSVLLAKDIISFFVDEFKQIGQTIKSQQAWEIYENKFSPKPRISINPEILLSYFEISKNIEKGLTGRYGIREWPEVTPRGVKDKSYLALEYEQKPLHFREVTSVINKLNANTERKDVFIGRALPQTVHNELIRDPRFVLIGRGMYALKKWGYQPGIVKDVIFRVLKESKQPLDKEEIVRKVLAKRLVKRSTVLLNLRNQQYFQKDSKGKYKIKEV